MDCLAMRIIMTTLTLRDLPMLFMTSRAAHLAMLALGGRPLAIHFLMTCLAGINLGLLTMEHDLKRFMRIMTGETILIDLTLNMRLMAIEAGWDQTMFGMTSCTTLLGMLAGELSYHATGAGMAIPALRLEVVVKGNNARGMRIGMAFETIGELVTMGQFQMAIRTFGHQVGIVSLDGVICVELGMAVLTGKLMLQSILLQVVKMPWMTLPTLGRYQRRRSFFIQLRGMRDIYHVRGHSRCGHNGHTEQSQQGPPDHDHLFRDFLL